MDEAWIKITNDRKKIAVKFTGETWSCEELTPQLLFLFFNYKDNLLPTGILLDEEQTTIKGFTTSLYIESLRKYISYY